MKKKKNFTYEMATLGHVKAFLPESNSITMYLERIDLLITTSKVEEDRKSAVLHYVSLGRVFMQHYQIY